VTVLVKDRRGYAVNPGLSTPMDCPDAFKDKLFIIVADVERDRFELVVLGTDPGPSFHVPLPASVDAGVS